jgi:hypothetical protein
VRARLRAQNLCVKHIYAHMYAAAPTHAALHLARAPTYRTMTAGVAQRGGSPPAPGQLRSTTVATVAIPLTRTAALAARTRSSPGGEAGGDAAAHAALARAAVVARMRAYVDDYILHRDLRFFGRELRERLLADLDELVGFPPAAAEVPAAARK